MLWAGQNKVAFLFFDSFVKHSLIAGTWQMRTRTLYPDLHRSVLSLSWL